MTKNNPTFYAIRILSEIIWDILYFPLWWYTHGFLELMHSLKTFLGNKEKSLALFVWIRNIFTPMYGQHDLAGALISFFMRIFQIIARGIAMLFWLLATALLVCFWLLLPIFVVYEIIYQLI